MARAMSRGVRAVAPSCLNNMYAVEEIEDIEKTETTQEELPELEVLDTGGLKRTLWNKLRKLNVIEADAKGFFEHFKLEEDVKLLEKLAEDDEELTKYLGEFENGN